LWSNLVSPPKGTSRRRPYGFRLGEAASKAFRLWISFKRHGKARDRDRMLKAAEDFDMLRMKSLEGWSGVKEIRKWRDMRT
jgi:hypothetical protein